MLNGKQIAVLTGAGMLTVMLYFAQRKSKVAGPEISKDVAPSSKESEIRSYIDKQIASLREDQKVAILSCQKRLNIVNDNIKQIVTDSLAEMLDKEKLPAVAAYYYEQLTPFKNTEKNWLGSAYRYFDGYKLTSDSVLRTILLSKAISAYKKVLELNPSNLDAKTDLGVCYTETPQPMQGIQLLRDVVSTNPNHENAQMNLGILSVRSRQYDKAEDRFNKVLAINPAHTEVYLYLGECYAETGRIDKAIEAFESYKSKGKDPELKKQAQQYIEQLKNTKTTKK